MYGDLLVLLFYLLQRGDRLYMSEFDVCRRQKKISQQTQNICIAFVQCWTKVDDVGPTLYKCYTNVLCLLGFHVNKHTLITQKNSLIFTCKLGSDHYQTVRRGGGVWTFFCHIISFTLACAKIFLTLFFCQFLYTRYAKPYDPGDSWANATQAKIFFLSSRRPHFLCQIDSRIIFHDIFLSTPPPFSPAFF